MRNKSQVPSSLKKRLHEGRDIHQAMCMNAGHHLRPIYHTCLPNFYWSMFSEQSPLNLHPCPCQSLCVGSITRGRKVSEDVIKQERQVPQGDGALSTCKSTVIRIYKYYFPHGLIGLHRSTSKIRLENYNLQARTYSTKWVVLRAAEKMKYSFKKQAYNASLC